MMKGILMATSDLNEAVQFSQNGFKVLFLGDPSGDLGELNKMGFMVAGPLVPDYNILSAEIDGDMQRFQYLYSEMLSRKPAMEFFASILSALFHGINVLLYFPQEAMGLKYVEFLMSYLMNLYGIITQTKSSQFAYNSAFNSANLKLMYMLNTISPQEFIMSSEELDTEIITKLANELQPYIENPNDINCYVNWASEYKKSLIEAGKPLESPLRYDNGGSLNC